MRERAGLLVALAGMLLFFNPSPADARIHVGVQIGRPYPVFPYSYPYSYDLYYYNYYPYGSTYVTPYGG
jgi:hypothetical protein